MQHKVNSMQTCVGVFACTWAGSWAGAHTVGAHAHIQGAETAETTSDAERKEVLCAFLEKAATQLERIVESEPVRHTSSRAAPAHARAHTQKCAQCPVLHRNGRYRHFVMHGSAHSHWFCMHSLVWFASCGNLIRMGK